MNEIKKPDRRVRRTKDLLRTHLLQLLMRKRLNEITVKELCEAANINRGTFYLHYMDVFDLFEKIQGDMYTEILRFIDKNASTANMGDPSGMLPTFLDLFAYLTQNPDVCTIMLTKDYNQEFVQKLLSIGLEECVGNWMRMYHLKDKRIAEMYYSYIVSGCVGILRNWLLTGRIETAAELAEMTKCFITQGIGMLENRSIS
jgi:AcrR family transcriptional regulator